MLPGAALEQSWAQKESKRLWWMIQILWRPMFLTKPFFVKQAKPLLKPSWRTQRRKTGTDLGTPAILMVANELGLLPTRNFSVGQFEKAEEIAGERVAEVIAARGGEGRSGTPCVRGCVISCSNIFPDPSGKKTVASIQYENIALLGPNCGIGDLDDIAELNHLCNEVGVDAIETGAAIGVAMEAGVIPFGDAEGAKDLIRQIGRGTYLGRILGNGVVITGKVLGSETGPCHQGPGHSRL